MKRDAKPSLFAMPRLSASYWIALCAAVVSFAIVSQSLLFAFVVAAAGFASKAVRPDAAPILLRLLRCLLVFALCFAAFAPLWPDRLSAFHGLPLLIIAAAAALPAAMERDLDGGRGIASIATVVFLLFLRNLVLYFEFQPPHADVAYAVAFICLLEIARSNQYRFSGDAPRAELGFGLLIALVASFSFDSFPLACALVTLPLASFLLRAHELARSDCHPWLSAQPNYADGHPPSRSKLPRLPAILLAVLPLSFAVILYLCLLRVPFWADYIHPRSPYQIQTIAERARFVSDSSTLQTQPARDFSHRLLDVERAANMLDRLASTALPNKPNSETRRTNPPAPSAESVFRTRRPSPYPTEASRPSEPRVQLPEYRGPFTQREMEASHPKTDPLQSLPPELRDLSDAPNISELYQRKTIDLPPPEPLARSEATSGQDPATSDAPNNNQQTPAAETFFPDSAPAEQIASESRNFDAFLRSFEQPQQAIGEALNLEKTKLPALLNEEPLASVRLDSSRGRPEKLYLRSNILDTIVSRGFGSIRSHEGKRSIPLPPGKPIELQTFRESERGSTALAITTRPRRFPTLPLPESFTAIETLDFQTLEIYPEDRVALAPLGSQSVTYRIHGADLDVSKNERRSSRTSDSYRQRMLELSLPSSDKAYLAELAAKVGGASSPPDRFANRIANYFANNHPYSFHVSIPSGHEHSVIRWLKNDSTGLCSNYATAFALLARSRGIPARVVTGYATEEYDPRNKRYIVRQMNAHAWVEYLDESNRWIRFDPTPRITPEEAMRAQSLVTAAKPNSLDQLLRDEANNIEKLNEEPSPESQLATATPQEISNEESEKPLDPQSPLAIDFDAATATEGAETFDLQSLDTAPESTHSSIPQAPSPQTSAPQTTPPIPSHQDLRAEGHLSGEAALTQSTGASSPPSPSPNKTEARPPKSQTPSSQSPAPSSEAPDADTGRPWLLILLALALSFPVLALLKQSRDRITQPVETKLRTHAGRLLHRTEQLVADRNLQNDPVWSQVQQSLSEQRYGRSPNPAIVKDLAVKVALLAKSKK